MTKIAMYGAWSIKSTHDVVFCYRPSHSFTITDIAYNFASAELLGKRLVARLLSEDSK
ncbi:MAG: hypothetical protein HC824_15280 [Synechococcales cyanobacterium RM1_1_8]|nr:hypothetical protein [Synechococcales cyanobacterium RM1_1_8]